MAEVEGSFEERFPEAVPQFPVIYDNGSFSVHSELALALVSALVLVLQVRTYFNGWHSSFP